MLSYLQLKKKVPDIRNEARSEYCKVSMLNRRYVALTFSCEHVPAVSIIQRYVRAEGTTPRTHVTSSKPAFNSVQGAPQSHPKYAIHCYH